MTKQQIKLTGTTWVNYRTWRKSVINPDEWVADTVYGKSGHFDSELIITLDGDKIGVTMSQHDQPHCDMEITHTTKRFNIVGPLKASKTRNYSGGANWRIETKEDENGLRFYILWSTEWNDKPEVGLHGVSVDVDKRGRKKEWSILHQCMEYPVNTTYLHLDLDKPSQKLLLDWFVSLVQEGRGRVEDRLAGTGYGAGSYRQSLTVEEVQ